MVFSPFYLFKITRFGFITEEGLVACATSFPFLSTSIALVPLVPKSIANANGPLELTALAIFCSPFVNIKDYLQVLIEGILREFQ
jgi:hypothetical protein